MSSNLVATHPSPPNSRTPMIPHSRFSALLLPFAFLASIPLATAGAQNKDEKQIQALLATYETSLNASDAGRIEQLYTEDGVFMPAGFPTAPGRSAVRGAYDAVFKNIRIAIHFSVDELKVKGDFAYARTHSDGTSTVVATGTTGPETSRELFIFARTAGGWKIARYLFNKSS
jgi:uncharacterized protein (TIGR02246 family)